MIQAPTCICAVQPPKSCRICPVHRHFYNPLNVWDDRDLVPGWHDSPGGQADAADQRKADRA